MSQIENCDFKIVIDALKYTSNIIVDITNKMTEQDEKILKLENNIIKIKKLCSEKNQNNIKIEKSLNFDSDSISSYIIEKEKKIEISNNESKNNILKDKSKINKLINSIVKKKNLLNDLIDNNEKSLLTDYNTNNTNNTNHNKLINDNSNLEFTFKTSKTVDDNDNQDTKSVDQKNNVDDLKKIRKKRNFARKF